MAAFVQMLTDVFAIQLSLGTETWTLGGIALASVIGGVALSLWRKVKGR